MFRPSFCTGIVVAVPRHDDDFAAGGISMHGRTVTFEDQDLGNSHGPYQGIADTRPLAPLPDPITRSKSG
jgi:hypothetical protein